jgi:hypothetical protein
MIDKEQAEQMLASPQEEARGGECGLLKEQQFPGE